MYHINTIETVNWKLLFIFTDFVTREQYRI
jgi:hypothetical protein